MNKRNLQKIIRVFLRGLLILFIAFFFVMSLDVFTGQDSYWMETLGYLIQIIPAIIMLIVLTISWKHEKLGGIIFLVLTPIFVLFFSAYRSWDRMLYICLPPLIISILYFISAHLDNKLKNLEINK